MERESRDVSAGRPTGWHGGMVEEQESHSPLQRPLTEVFYASALMLDCWLLDLIDCLRYEEDKIAGNTRDRGEKQERARVRAGYFRASLGCLRPT